MDRVIIGIHGLRNKPPASILKDWWTLSIRDGFDSIARPQLPFHFELLYWVDLLYKEPTDLFLTKPDHPLFTKHPYKKLITHTPHKIDIKRQRSRLRLEKISDQLFHSDRILKSFEGISDRFIHSRFHDLEVYLRNEKGYGEAEDRPVRDIILERLGNLLLKYRHKKIMVIAHSMGSLVIYDLLTQPDNPFHVHTLFTMGSPLGQPMLMAKFSSENPVVSKLKTPDNIEHWYNLSDLKDRVALDPTLGDDYAPNDKGVTAIDTFIENSYTWNGKSSPHTIHGYLQSPVCAQYIYDFLTKGRSSLALTLGRQQQKLWDTIFKERERMFRRSQSRQEEDASPETK